MSIIKWIGGGPEDETPRHGILSSRAEWHALLIGSSIGFIISLVGGKDAAWLFIILSGIALGTKKVEVGHLNHVSKEPVYALVAAVASFLIGAFLIIPNLPGGII